MGEFDDLIEEFVNESKEHIADIEEDLIKIEADKESVDPEVINRVFRAAHSIKGSAKFLDLINIGELAHKMEDVLNLIRSGKLLPSSTISTPLLQAADMLKTMFEDVMESNSMDISENVSQLQKILDGKIATEEKSSQKNKNPKTTTVLSQFDLDRKVLEHKLDAGQVYVLTALPADKLLEEFIVELAELGEVLSCCEKGDSPSILFFTIMEPDMVTVALGISNDSIVQIGKEHCMPERTHHSPKNELKSSQPTGDHAKMDVPEEIHVLSDLDDIPDVQGISYDEGTSGQGTVVVNSRAKKDLREENTSFITFTLDQEIYAVPIQAIEEIIGKQEMSLLPNVPDFIKGVINLRGELIPIMDLRLKFGMVEKEYNQFTVFLIMRVEDKLTGMVVDNVADVLVIDARKVQKTPTFSTKISTEFIDGVYKDQDEMVILMNVPSLIKPEEWISSQAQN
ncbi:MAG: chemotaxis protein CheW [Desulfomonilia bacterium]